MTAPFLDDIRPTTHRFGWGDAQIITVLDGAQVKEPLNPPFAMDKDDAALQAIGAAHRLPWDKFENTYTPTLINTGSQLVLFDVGFGEKGRDANAGYLRARLAEAGYAPEDIDVVAFTHMHPDHFLGVMEGGELAFPNARLVMGRKEFDEWKSGDNIPPQRAPNREMFMNIMVPLADQLTFLEDGDSVVPGITAEAGFGHSLGHMMYRYEGGGQQLLVWGDVTNHYIYSLRHPDSTVGFDDDKDAAIATRKRVLDMVATDNLLVAGHHMPFPSIGYVEKSGTSYRWEPASYQLRLGQP